jgi:hypothetical protein
MKIVFVYKKNMSMKNLMRLTFIIAIAIFVGYNVYKSRSAMDGLSEMALANVEALARDEIENVKCNREISATCILINGNPVRG